MRIVCPTLAQLKIKRGTRVLVRVDYNIDNPARDDFRVRVTLPLLATLMKRKAIPILVSHRGRPDPAMVDKKSYSLVPVAAHLAVLLKRSVTFVEGLPDESSVQNRVRALVPGQIAMLDNLRFHPGEDRNDARLARALAGLADVYINEAFATCHRRLASLVAITRYLPAAAGPHLAAEVRELVRAREHAEHPFVLLLGGAKVSTKLPLLRRYLHLADRILLGGAIGLQFLAARGETVQMPLLEPALFPTVQELLRAGRDRIVLPVDHNHDRDIGPKTSKLFIQALRGVRLIVWNGTLGMFEEPAWRAGTTAIARAVARSGAHTIVGGGETVAAISQLGLIKKYSFVSTGGGAMLECLEGRPLPGIDALCKSISSPKK